MWGVEITLINQLIKTFLKSMELGHKCLRLAIQWVQLSSHLSKVELFICNVGINIPPSPSSQQYG